MVPCGGPSCPGADAAPDDFVDEARSAVDEWLARRTPLDRDEFDDLRSAFARGPGAPVETDRYRSVHVREAHAVEFGTWAAEYDCALASADEYVRFGDLAAVPIDSDSDSGSDGEGYVPLLFVWDCALEDVRERDHLLYHGLERVVDEQGDTRILSDGGDEAGFASDLAELMGGDGDSTPDPHAHSHQRFSSALGSRRREDEPEYIEAEPTSGIPVGQLDALAPAERRRAAKKRGLSWPTTDEARDRLFDTIAEVIREEDERVVDAPTALGKTFTVATTRWGAREDITGGNRVVHLLETRAARDEAVAAAQAHGGDHMVLKARHEACPVAAGDHDPHPAEGDGPDQPISIDGIEASEWIARMCDQRGLPFSAVHRYLEDHNDQGVDLPCCAGDGRCEAITQWDRLREGDHPLVIATHNFAHVPGLRTGANIVIDELPDYAQDLTTARVRRAVAAFLDAIDAPVSSWEAFVGLSRMAWDASGDAAAEAHQLDHVLDREPDREWYFECEDAHILAPALARAIFDADERANGLLFGQTAFEPPRLDAEARDDEGWNRTWVKVVIDEQTNDIRSVRVTPDLSLARSVVGLDAHPSLPVWQANTVPHIAPRPVLDPTERRLWRRYERGLRVVQVGDATRPLASGTYFNERGCRAVVEQLRAQYGDDFRTAITAKAVEDDLTDVLRDAGVRAPETMHFGEEKSRNDFVRERVGFVNGCIDPGDEPVLTLLAELDLDAEPEREDDPCWECEGEGCPECDGVGHYRAHGRAFVGPDARLAASILASVRESHTAQAAGRYARDADDPDATATVYVRTDAIPTGFADLQVPGVIWAYGPKQERIIQTLADADGLLPAREIAERADCSKEHVRQTLRRLDDIEGGPAEVHAVEEGGKHGATLYAVDGAPNSGVADVGETANSVVWDYHTWGLAIHDPEDVIDTDDDGQATTDECERGGGPPDGWGSLVSDEVPTD